MNMYGHFGRWKNFKVYSMESDLMLLMKHVGVL